jgi:signal peptidase I
VWFETILVALTVLTGVVWLLDKLFFAKRRMAAAGVLEEAKEPVVVDYAKAFFPILALVLGLRSFVGEPFRIPSSSMMPTLLIGDFILVNKFAYGLRLPVSNEKVVEIGSPERGDVVVFRYPLDVSEFYVKRLIGLPGDVVRFDGGVVSVNGAPFDAKVVSEGVGANVAPEDRGQWLLDETSAGNSRTVKVNPFVMGRLAPSGMGAACVTGGPTAWECRVPAGEYLMMGDNRDNSSDSRVNPAIGGVGFVPAENLVGKAQIILLSWKPEASIFKPWTWVLDARPSRFFKVLK